MGLTIIQRVAHGVVVALIALAYLCLVFVEWIDDLAGLDPEIDLLNR